MAPWRSTTMRLRAPSAAHAQSEELAASNPYGRRAVTCDVDGPASVGVGVSGVDQRVVSRTSRVAAAALAGMRFARCRRRPVRRQLSVDLVAQARVFLRPGSLI